MAKMLEYWNFPKIPEHLESMVVEFATNKEIPPELVEKQIVKTYTRWPIENGSELHSWLVKNVSPNMEWAIQIINGDLNVHSDLPYCTCKLSYLFETGGSRVYTQFFNDSGRLLERHVIMKNRWHLLNVQFPHNVIGVEPNSLRISLGGRVFSQMGP